MSRPLVHVDASDVLLIANIVLAQMNRNSGPKTYEQIMLTQLVERLTAQVNQSPNIGFSNA